jgi:hypothetical protein
MVNELFNANRWMDERIYRQTDMTLLTVAFHNIADAPKCVSTLEYLGTLSVKSLWCTDPNTSALGYTFPVRFLLFI